MKIKSIKVLEDGMESKAAEKLWDKIEQFASYSFNKSHAVEYSIISYWCMWVKVHFPAAFYAATLTVMGEERLSGIVKDAEKRDIYVVPPEINISTNDFEIAYDSARAQTLLVAPFNRIKGLSEKTAKFIIEARDRVGMFRSMEHFVSEVNKSKVNARHREAMNRVGVFASVEAGKQLPARHPDRLKDQMELLPGLVTALIKADRVIEISGHVKGQIVKLINEVRECKGCDLQGGVHPIPRLGKSAKFMVVTDHPNWSEERAAKMLEGDASNFLRAAIKAAGLTTADGYFTSMVKAPKTGKTLTNEQINGCCGYLHREVELLKPPVIVALGGVSIRHFVPDAKGGFADLCGQVHYIPALDASVVFGINPGMIAFEPSRQDMLNEVFEKVAELIGT